MFFRGVHFILHLVIFGRWEAGKIHILHRAGNGGALPALAGANLSDGAIIPKVRAELVAYLRHGQIFENCIFIEFSKDNQYNVDVNLATV